MSDDATAPGDLVIAVVVDDERYDFHPFEVSPALASALRLGSHNAWRYPTLIRAVFEEDGQLCGPEEIAGLLFLARRQRGESISYDAVCQSLDGHSQVTVIFETPNLDTAAASLASEVEPDSPPPSGGQ